MYIYNAWLKVMWGMKQLIKLRIRSCEANPPVKALWLVMEHFHFDTYDEIRKVHRTPIDCFSMYPHLRATHLGLPA